MLSMKMEIINIKVQALLEGCLKGSYLVGCEIDAPLGNNPTSVMRGKHNMLGIQTSTLRR